jgi:tRNA threonylcarbamoyladenosine biosynthesis protein TsaE
MERATGPGIDPQGGWHPPAGWVPVRALRVADAGATERLAARLADATRTGDTILLSGEVGAGKTHLARAFIRHALGPGQDAAEVPSPSFTLVQTYETDAGEIWHADLYRLGGADEIVELGLDLAMEDARCLVEWPERMGSDWPERAVALRMVADPDGNPEGRVLTLWALPDAGLGGRLAAVWDAGA